MFAAGLIGYLIGGWHPAALRATDDPSAADAVALRFPPAWDAAPAISPPAVTDKALADSGVLPEPGVPAPPPATASSDNQLVLFDPAPMVPQRQPGPELRMLQDAAGPTVQLASTAPPSGTDLDSIRRAEPPPAMPARAQRPVKIPAVAVQRRPINRPGYMLDDAQIASIKERLHLTPEQEQMWPAVAAALRNIAYSRAQQASGRDTGIMRTGDIDPESVENLKSAAVPLIMSFDDDQKQQVRNLAHVMGLDRLASEF